MAHWTISVYDDRPELRKPTTPLNGRLVATHENALDSWSNREIIVRYGIAEHFYVTRRYPGGPEETVQYGRR